MKVAANKTTSVFLNLGNSLRHALRFVGAELRRGIQLAGEKYMNGIVPPL